MEQQVYNATVATQAREQYDICLHQYNHSDEKVAAFVNAGKNQVRARRNARNIIKREVGETEVPHPLLKLNGTWFVKNLDPSLHPEVKKLLDGNGPGDEIKMYQNDKMLEIFKKSKHLCGDGTWSSEAGGPFAQLYGFTSVVTSEKNYEKMPVPTCFFKMMDRKKQNYTRIFKVLRLLTPE